MLKLSFRAFSDVRVRANFPSLRKSKLICWQLSPRRTLSFKLHLRERRTDEETRLFVRCIGLGRPSYVLNKPRFIEI